MTQRDDRPQSDFAARLETARQRNRAEKSSGSGELARGGVMYGLGFRVAVEMAAGVAVGGGIGYLLDRAFGTAPWILIGMLPLGFAAGFLNAWRAAKQAGRTAEREAAERADADRREG